MRFSEKLPLKINTRNPTLKVAYEELARIKPCPGADIASF
jgi:hypothetical protein